MSIGLPCNTIVKKTKQGQLTIISELDSHSVSYISKLIPNKISKLLHKC